MSDQKPRFTREEIDRLFENAQERSHSQPVQLHGWVQEAARASREVAQGNVDLIGTYWITLFGTLHDLRNHVDINRQGVIERLLPLPNRQKSAAARVAVLKARLDAIDGIRQLLDDDDCVYLQFMRHVHSHPLLDNYGITIRGNKLKVNVTHHLIDKALSVEETDAAIMRVLRRREELLLLMGSHIERVTARDFALRTHKAQQDFAAVWDEPDRVRSLAEIRRDG